MRSRLGTQFVAFFRLIARILTLRDNQYRILTFRDKKYRIFSFRDKKYRILTFRDRTELYVFHSGSLWLSLALRLTLAHSGSLWLAVRLSLALSGSLWLPLARCPTLSGSLWLSQALYCSPNSLTKPLLGSQGPCSARNAVPEFPHFNQPWSDVVSKL